MSKKLELVADVGVPATPHDENPRKETTIWLTNRVCGYCDAVLGQTFKRCSQCHATRYCSEKCQKNHWGDHKSLCKAFMQFSGSQSGPMPLVLVSCGVQCRRVTRPALFCKYGSCQRGSWRFAPYEIVLVVTSSWKYLSH